MLTFKVQTNLSEALAAAIGKAATRAEHIVAVQAAKDTSPYVPFLTGSLDERTRVSGNTIIYPGPYARFLYYGKVMVDPGTVSRPSFYRSTTESLAAWFTSSTTRRRSVSACVWQAQKHNGS